MLSRSRLSVIACIAFLATSGLLGCNGGAAHKVGKVPTSRIESFSSDPVSVKKGESASLSWKTTGATTVELSDHTGAVSNSGALVVRPDSTSIYTLKAIDANGGLVLAETIVFVDAQEPDNARANPASICGALDSSLNGKHDALEAMLARHANLTENICAVGPVFRPVSFIPPLHYAAGHGGTDTAKILLASHADVNGRDSEGKTPLFWATVTNRAAMVEFLLYHGANSEIRSSTNLSPLEAAAAENDAFAAMILLDHGADPNVIGRDGGSAIHYATFNGNDGIAEMLLNYGADINAKTQGGRTPLHNAAHIGDLNLVKLLVERGANVNAKDADGVTPYQVARLLHRAQVVSYFRWRWGVISAAWILAGITLVLTVGLLWRRRATRAASSGQSA